MSTSAPWYETYQNYTDSAAAAIKECVSIMRARGHTIPDSYPSLSYRLKITPRRVRTLFRRDITSFVDKGEWDRLRQRAGGFFLEEAVRLRELAKAYEKVGTKIISDGDISELPLVGEKIRAATTAPGSSLDI
jgi:hypothetical protein